MKVEVTSERYTPELLRANPNKVYVFGDNLQRWGHGGQAIIRDEYNSFGIPTKNKPSNDDNAFFEDEEYLEESEALFQIDRSIDALFDMGKRYTIVFPSGGLGTGLSAMPTKCPKLFKLMNQALLNTFGVINSSTGLTLSEPNK